MKKIALLLLCMLVVLALAGCAAINQDNSFPNAATDEVTAMPQAQPTSEPNAEQPVTETTEAPNTDPNASGYNG